MAKRRDVAGAVLVAASFGMAALLHSRTAAALLLAAVAVMALVVITADVAFLRGFAAAQSRPSAHLHIDTGDGLPWDHPNIGGTDVKGVRVYNSGGDVALEPYGILVSDRFPFGIELGWVKRPDGTTPTSIPPKAPMWAFVHSPKEVEEEITIMVWFTGARGPATARYQVSNPIGAPYPKFTFLTSSDTPRP
jgi:hypothetical protein